MKPLQRGEMEGKQTSSFKAILKIKKRTKCLNHSIQTHQNDFEFLL